MNFKAIPGNIGTEDSGEFTFEILFIGHLDHLLVMGLKKMIRLGKVRTGRDRDQSRLNCGKTASDQE